MTDRIREFLHDEAAGGLVLLAATIVALVWANSGLDYDGLLAHRARRRSTCTTGSTTG